MAWFGQELFNRITGARSRELERKIAALRRRNIGDRLTTVNPDEATSSQRTGAEGSDLLSEHIRVERSVSQREADYAMMGMYSDVILALDVYADEAVIPNDDGRILWATAKDRDLGDMVNTMLKDRVKIDSEAWPLARNIAHWGNVYSEPLLYEGLGVIGNSWLDRGTMRRVEDERANLVGFVQVPKSRTSNATSSETPIRQFIRAKEAASQGQIIPGVTAFEPWEVIHFRMRGEGMNDLYGTSMLEAARWHWKRLHTLEDAALLHKLTRAASRYLFKIDVGDTPTNGMWAFLNKVMVNYKRRRYVDTSGKIRLGPDALSPEDDIAVPTKNGKDLVSVDILAGTDYQDMTPVDYFSAKFYAALKIPKLRVGSGEEIRKDALIGQDVGFARLIMRLQGEMIRGVEQITTLHLLALGIDPEYAFKQGQLVHRMSISSQIFELARMELLSARADLMQRWNGMASPRWILENIGKLSSSEAEEVWQQLMKDKLVMGEVDAEVAGMQQEAMMGGQGGPPPAPGGAAEAIFRYEPDRATRASERKLEEAIRGMATRDMRLERRMIRLEAICSELSTRIRRAA